MCRIKFQGESLETFVIYEVVLYPENDDLGVVGPPGPSRSVTVKFGSPESGPPTFKYRHIEAVCTIELDNFRIVHFEN